jgi:hypothetical protein
MRPWCHPIRDLVGNILFLQLEEGRILRLEELADFLVAVRRAKVGTELKIMHPVRAPRVVEVMVPD